MRIHKPLSKILNSTTKVDILRLFFRTNKQMNVREIARELSITAPTANLALKELDKEGILFRMVTGSMHIYSLKKSPWVSERLLKRLFIEEEKLPDELLRVIGKYIKESKIKDSILSVAIFGSFYTKKEQPGSDIDLLIIVKESQDKKKVEDLIFKLDKEIFPKIGLSLEPHVNTIVEFKRKFNDGLPLMKEIMKANKVCYGQNLEVLL